MPYAPCHVEIDETDFFFWLLACVLALGIALKMAYLVIAPDAQDWFVAIAVWVSFVLVIALIFVMVIGFQMAG